MTLAQLAPYYGFSRLPFGRRIAVQRALLLATHQEAIGLLAGEVGSGKTVAARVAVASLDQSRHTVIYLANPTVGARGLYHQLVLAFGGEPRFQTAAVIPQAHELLAYERAERGKRVVVVIDEAHLLDPSQLEKIRLLTNAEMDSESSFAGILLGQPNLGPRLRLSSFAALDQRLALRYELHGISGEESAAYPRHHRHPRRPGRRTLLRRRGRAPPSGQPRPAPTAQQPRYPGARRRLCRPEGDRRRRLRPRRRHEITGRVADAPTSPPKASPSVNPSRASMT